MQQHRLASKTVGGASCPALNTCSVIALTILLGVVVGIVLGGSQALSRSFYGAMIPKEASAEFYGFYSVFSKFSAIWGPLVFAIIRQITGTPRLAIISLMIFFIVGLILLAFVDEEKAKEAKRSGAF